MDSMHVSVNSVIILSCSSDFKDVGVNGVSNPDVFCAKFYGTSTKNGNNGVHVGKRVTFRKKKSFGVSCNKRNSFAIYASFQRRI